MIGWLRDQLPLADLDRAVIHGDYHGNNVMLEHGAVTGVLDWGFAIADPAVDLANMTNVYLVFAQQLDPGVSPHVREQGVDGVFKAYEAFRPVNQKRIQAFRVLHLFGAFAGAATGPEFMRRPESRREYLSLIEQTTGFTLSPPT